MNVRGVLASRLRLARHLLLEPRRARARSPLVVSALLAVMAAVAASGFHTLFRTLSLAGATPSELGAALGLVLDAAGVTLVVLGLDAAVATLVLDPDLELLRRAPVRPVALLALKLLDALPRTGSPLLVLALPAMAAFGVVQRTGPAFVPAALGSLAALWLVSIGLGVALALPLLRVVPARRAREALGLVATLVLTAVWLASAMWTPQLANEGGAPLESLRAALRLAGAAPVPTPGRAAAAALLGSTVSAGGAGAWLELAALALAAGLLAALGAAWFLRRVLESVATTPPRPAVARPRPPARGDRPRPWLGAVLERDARLFFRDWTVLADVATAAMLWTLLPFFGRALFAAGGAALATAMLASLAIGLGYEVAARSVPFERRAATWMRLAPVPAPRWALAKLAGSAAVAGPLFLAAWAILAVSLRLSPSQALEALTIGSGALALALGLGLWAGTRFGDPRWINPRAMLTLEGRLLAAGLMIVQISIWIGVIAFLDSGSPGVPRAVVSTAAMAAATLTSVVPIRSAAGRITRLGWYA